MKILFNPLETVSRRVLSLLLISETILFFVIWNAVGIDLIPGPKRVFNALVELLKMQDFYNGLVSSMFLTCKAMGISILIALLISYTYFIPILKPVGIFIGKCRFLTLTGLIFLFTLLTKDGSQLKMSLLIFGIVPFFVTSMVAQLEAINVQEYELCKTLRMNNWRTWFEVIIIGRLDFVVETMRQNFAIAWLMITMIEGLSMSQGGLGVMLLKANKYMDIPRVFALLIIVFVIGIFFDFILGKIRFWLFPYAKLGLVK